MGVGVVDLPGFGIWMTAVGSAQAAPRVGLPFSPCICSVVMPRQAIDNSDLTFAGAHGYQPHRHPRSRPSAARAH